jgi:hypothetical protein
LLIETCKKTPEAIAGHGGSVPGAGFKARNFIAQVGADHALRECVERLAGVLGK